MNRRVMASVGVLCAALGGVGLATAARRGASVQAKAPATTAKVAPPARAEPRAIAETFVGVLLPARTVNLAARLDGKLAAVNAELGAVVHEGDLVAALDMKLGKHELNLARAGVDAARATRGVAGVELARARDRTTRRRDATVTAGGATLALVSGEEAAQATFDERSGISKLHASTATLVQEQARTAQALTLLEHHELRAPFDGVIAARFLDQGAYVKAGEPVLRIVSTGPLVARFAVAEERSTQLAVGDRVTVTMDATSFAARIARISPEVEPASRTVFVEATSEAATARCSDGCPGLAGRVVRVAAASQGR